jgi:hypothetical protein
MAETEGFEPATSPSGISKLMINIAHSLPEAPNSRIWHWSSLNGNRTSYIVCLKRALRRVLTACRYSISASGTKP